MALAGALLLPTMAMMILMPWRGTAHGQGPMAFGIQPAGSGAGDPGAYFAYALEAGASASDQALVINSGQELVQLRVYAADGVTAINGSTAFGGPDEQRTGVRSWLSTSVSQLTLAPGQRATVPFTVSVPPEIEPGDHVAGWVVEAAPREGQSQGLAATVVERAGVAVVVRVPGPTTEQLSLGSICLNQETGSNYLETSVANNGNVLTRGQGNLTLALKNGKTVFERPAELGTVLPADSTLLRLDAPFDPGPGEYVASLALESADGQRVEASNEIKIGDRKVNGCVAVASERLEGERGVFSLPGGTTPWLFLVPLGVLLAALVGMRVYLGWRRQPDDAARK